MTTEDAWLDEIRALMLRGDYASAKSAIDRALRHYPHSFPLRRILAGVQSRTLREAEAEVLLRKLLTERPDDAGTAFALARMLAGQCRSAAAAKVMRDYFAGTRPDPELAIQAIELLDDCGRKRDAAAIAEFAILANPDDTRLHAYAATLEIQLGDFKRARACYLRAMDAPQACEWHVPYGLALVQRYHDAHHSDFALFRDCLQRTELSGKARSSLLFALAKAHDDIGDYACTAEYSRQANALAHELTNWSRKHWRRAVDAKLNATSPLNRLEPTTGFVPILIVGMPRSGTTLAAELLARFPQVCNRGESPWLATLAEHTTLNGQPQRSALQHAAATYATQLRQDDSQSACWFIDKQPLNWRYIDLIMALFPNSQVVYCRRSARDNALSLWMQSFLEDVQGYAYDFTDMAQVMHDCVQMMSHWQKMYPNSIHTIDYERLVSAPEKIITELAMQLGLPPCDIHATHASPTEGIATASVWQARQRVYTRSVGRWKNYATLLPELLEFQVE